MIRYSTERLEAHHCPSTNMPGLLKSSELLSVFLLQNVFLWTDLFSFYVFVLGILAYIWLKCLKPQPTNLYASSSTVDLPVADRRKQTKLMTLIQTRVPSLFKPFSPAWWLPG